MMLSLPTWTIPLVMTVALWAFEILRPLPASRGDYDFGPSITGLIRLCVAVVGTLAFWLIFFMAKAGGLA